MTMKQSIIITILAFLCGALFYAYNQGWIVIHYPTNAAANHTQGNAAAPQKKKVKLFFWHNGSWKTETTTILWSNNKATALSHLINRWLTLLDDEGLLNKKTTLQTALLAPSEQELFLSFDRSPFSRQQSIQEKLMFVEGLLKTIRDTNTGIQAVRFLVHHQPLIDDHLDFGHAWPIIGYLSQS